LWRIFSRHRIHGTFKPYSIIIHILISYSNVFVLRICHARLNPDCPLIQLGKRSHTEDGDTKGTPKPDDYTMREFIGLCRDRRILYVVRTIFFY
jgi:hypothetical protein